MARRCVLRNEGGNKNHCSRLELKGGADNKTGTGTKVEVFADGQWQKWELAGASGYMSQGAAGVDCGTGQLQSTRTSCGFCGRRACCRTRSIWRIEAGERDGEAIGAAVRARCCLRGMGTRYKFVTDVIGAAVVGHWFTPTRRNMPIRRVGQGGWRIC